jgi:hypothetical protein
MIFTACEQARRVQNAMNFPAEKFASGRTVYLVVHTLLFDSYVVPRSGDSSFFSSLFALAPRPGQGRSLRLKILSRRKKAHSGAKLRIDAQNCGYSGPPPGLRLATGDWRKKMKNRENQNRTISGTNPN